jgi:outer membrane protein TolC
MDLQQVRLQVQALAANLGLMKSTRLINVLELGPARVLEGQRGDAYKKGFEVAFELPIFDWGTARVVRAEAIYNQALNVATQMVVEARSEVREAYLGYRTSYDVARHLRDEIVPLRKRISEENLLRYNGMLIGVFELLADTRSQIAAVDSAIQAQRDFWVAQADLEMAMIGKPTLSGAIGAMAQADGASPAH